MQADASPFRDPAHRLARGEDRLIACALAAKRSTVMLIGLRRTGKTALIRHLSRETEAPLVEVSIPVIPLDLQATAVVRSLLDEAIDELQETAPLVSAEYRRLTEVSHRRALSENGVPPLTAIKTILGHLERAARKCKVRPIVFFDDFQELVHPGKRVPDVKAALAIRDCVKRHEACRYVFAGSDVRFFRELATTPTVSSPKASPLFEALPLTTSELDAWAKPIFEAGGRRFDSLAPTNEVLAGKIGEDIDVLDQLWMMTEPGSLIGGALQWEAIVRAFLEMPYAPLGRVDLTRPQTAVLRWVVCRPGLSPYGPQAVPALKLNPGTVSSSLKALVKQGLLEKVDHTYVPTLPLWTMRMLSLDLAL